jgi:hypothetical protein
MLAEHAGRGMLPRPQGFAHVSKLRHRQNDGDGQKNKRRFISKTGACTRSRFI